jgi:hypothetical protein
MTPSFPSPGTKPIAQLTREPGAGERVAENSDTCSLFMQPYVCSCLDPASVNTRPKLSSCCVTKLQR